MFGAFLYALTWLRRGFFTFAVVFILLTLLYSAVVFFRHKELGGLFVFLTAVFSTLIQFVTGYVFLILFMSGISFDSGEGHPNGDAILLLVIMAIQPVLKNIGAFVVWLIKKIIWLFK